jgi:hypothetical protein
MAESKKRKTARERLTSLLGDFPQGFNAGMLAGIPGWAGDIGYLLQEYPRALLTDTPLRPPVEYAGTTDSIAKAAGYEIPGTLSGQLGAAVGGLLSPGPGDLAKFAPLLAGVMPVADDAGRAAGMLSLPADARLETARKNAVSMLGLPENNTAMDRARAMGFEPGWYHGTDADVQAFDPDLLGSTTQAKSAEKGFFFASNPRNAGRYPAYQDEVLDDWRNALRLDTAEGEAESKALRREINSTMLMGDAEKRAWIEIQDPNKYPSVTFDDVQGTDAVQSFYKTFGQENPYTQEYADAYAKAHSQAVAELASRFKDDEFKSRYQRIRAEERDYNDYLNARQWSDRLKLSGLDGEEFDPIKVDSALQPNIIPAYLRMENPLTHDYARESYRDRAYTSVIKDALRNGNDAAILRNTADPLPTDVAVVFDPSRIRSRFAAFDPARINDRDLLASLAALGILTTGGMLSTKDKKEKDFK